MVDKLTFIDLFAGCGGLSEGFMQSGKYKSLAHVEWELPMVSTLRNRLETRWGYSEIEAKDQVVHFDVQRTSELINGFNHCDDLDSYKNTNSKKVVDFGLRGLVENNKVDLIIGGPPCQAYSIAGRAQDPNSMKDDYRNYLFESFVKIVNEFKPQIFVFENVPGLLSACPGNILVSKRIFESFKNIGYRILSPDNLKSAVLDTSEYGVPQKRKRLIIVGISENSSIDLESIYTGLKLIRTPDKLLNVKNAIESLPPLLPLKKQAKFIGRNQSHIQIEGEKILNHVPRFHNSRDIEIFKHWLSNKMNSKSNDEKILFYNNTLNKQSNHNKYRNLEWDKPSPTIVAHLYKDGLMFIHPDIKQLRSITVREAALLQSFPIDYEFVGSNNMCFKMVGNAVPPIFAAKISNVIHSILTKNEK